jgi:DNA-binding transcriptional regulator YiaG
MQNAHNVASCAESATYEDEEVESESSTVMTFTVKDMDARICRRIGIYRERAGLTQEQLGARLDPPVRRNEVNRWENGHKTPYRWRQHQIALVLGVDPGLLYVENGDVPDEE